MGEDNGCGGGGGGRVHYQDQFVKLLIQLVREFQKPMAVATMSTLLGMYSGIDPLTSRFTG